MSRHRIGCAAVVAQTAQSISICPNRRGAREFLVLVLVLALGNGAIEDENEDDDDLIAASPRRAALYRRLPTCCIAYRQSARAAVQRTADLQPAMRRKSRTSAAVRFPALFGWNDRMRPGSPVAPEKD